MSQYTATRPIAPVQSNEYQKWAHAYLYPKDVKQAKLEAAREYAKPSAATVIIWSFLMGCIVAGSLFAAHIAGLL